MSFLSNELVKTIYTSENKIGSHYSIEKWLNNNNVRYYSLARHALESALRLLQVGEGDSVAMPEFICRDLIAAVSTVGASIVFYPVDHSLRLASKSDVLSQSKVIIVVNYFGFPQDLTVFEEIARKTNAVLIEDNAHGFLSCDESKIPLGTRTQIGIFSLRKTIPLLNGAALVVNNNELVKFLPEQLPSDFKKTPVAFQAKRILRNLVPVIGVKPCQFMTGFIRITRKMRTGQSIPVSNINAEKTIPAGPQPYYNLWNDLSDLNVSAEIFRRRNIYIQLDDKIREYGGKPVFDKLLGGVSPYAFPFRSDAEHIERIRQWLKKMNLECYRWPVLPGSVLLTARQHYLNLWMIPFSW